MAVELSLLAVGLVATIVGGFTSLGLAMSGPGMLLMAVALLLLQHVRFRRADRHGR